MKHILALMFLLTFGGIALAQTASPTEISLQGQLKDDGSTAQGTFDFRFSLFDAEAEGVQIGLNTAADAVPVQGGLFFVLIDFGPDAWHSSLRWIQVSVRHNGGGGSFVILSPRLRVTGCPFAVGTGSVIPPVQSASLIQAFEWIPSGVHTVPVPTGTSVVEISAWGGGAGGRYDVNTSSDLAGGSGAFGRVAFSVQAGDVITLTVGAGGITGGWTGAPSGPGGPSVIWINGVEALRAGGGNPGAAGLYGTGRAIASGPGVRLPGLNGFQLSDFDLPATPPPWPAPIRLFNVPNESPKPLQRGSGGDNGWPGEAGYVMLMFSR